jgi:hypothetical protein
MNPAVCNSLIIHGLLMLSLSLKLLPVVIFEFESCSHIIFGQKLAGMTAAALMG